MNIQICLYQFSKKLQIILDPKCFENDNLILVSKKFKSNISYKSNKSNKINQIKKRIYFHRKLKKKNLKHPNKNFTYILYELFFNLSCFFIENLINLNFNLS